MATYKHTFCRICEPYCPMLAEIDESGELVRLLPDDGHPSGGQPCHKGLLSALDVHRNPDRLSWPLRRLNAKNLVPGEFGRATWDDIMIELGQKLLGVRETYGNDAIAVYMGNPWSMSAPMFYAAMDLQAGLGTAMRFNSNTQDTLNKRAAMAEIYGTTSALMIPDLQNTDYLLCLGTNPKVSRWTTASMPNDGLAALRRIRQRGGKVRFVNPRRTESSTEETGPTLMIRPGTDVYFLAALLHEIDELGGFDEKMIAAHGERIEELRAFISNFPADRVKAVTGLEPDAIRQVASELVSAKSAAVYMATGLNQSRQGVLCYWLVEMINFVTGNLGRRGGTYKPTGLNNSFAPFEGRWHIQTSIGEFSLPQPTGTSALPAVLMPDLIDSGDIRALIILGGNPLLTVGGEDRMRAAFEKLDVIVSVDIFQNATGEVADFILPATAMLERIDINHFALGGQPFPYLQYTDAVVAPKDERRNGWWIVARMLQALGLPSPLDLNPEADDGVELIGDLLGTRNLSIQQVRQAPHQSIAFKSEPYDVLFDRCLKRANGRVDCCPPAFSDTGLIERCEAIFRELAEEPADQLKLIGLRTPYMQNSSLTNERRFRRGKEGYNPLHICERDAKLRGLFNGDDVRVYNTYGSIQTVVQIDDDLRQGVVAMSHGYGNAKTYGMGVARLKPGANVNALMPVGPGTFEPLSYMSWLSGVPVSIERISN